ncbi:MAG: tetratricopeptide repeat protein, partial [Magnetococcales bacterium]|nr:tetratricopeptide repeat protein [Magnetococcales bacterium]
MNAQKTSNSDGVELTVDSAYLQALEHFAGGRYSQADKLCTAIINALPTHIDAINLIGVIAQKVNQHAIAVEQFQKAIDIDNSRGLLYYNVALSLKQLGRKTEAIQALNTAHNLEPENSQIADYLQGILNPDKKAQDLLVEATSHHQS